MYAKWWVSVGDCASLVAKPEPTMPDKSTYSGAERLGHNGIGCEHLLRGILTDESGPAATVLSTHGVTLDGARRWTDEVNRRWLARIQCAGAIRLERPCRRGQLGFSRPAWRLIAASQNDTG